MDRGLVTGITHAGPISDENPLIKLPDDYGHMLMDLPLDFTLIGLLTSEPISVNEALYVLDAQERQPQEVKMKCDQKSRRKSINPSQLYSNKEKHIGCAHQAAHKIKILAFHQNAASEVKRGNEGKTHCIKYRQAIG